MPANPNAAGVTPYLATLQVDTSANWSLTYADIGAQRRLTPGKHKRGASKSSNLASANRWHTFKQGWLEGGDFKGLFVFKAADYATLFTMFVTDTDPRYFRIRYNDGTGPTTGSNETFLGLIIELGEDQFDDETEDMVLAEITIKPSGPIVFNSAT